MWKGLVLIFCVFSLFDVEEECVLKFNIFIVVRLKYYVKDNVLERFLGMYVFFFLWERSWLFFKLS